VIPVAIKKFRGTMKIKEHDSMMAYLKRKPNILSNNINKTNTERTGLAKGTKPDTKVMPKKDKMLQYISDVQIVYGDKKATKAETEAATKRVDSYKKQMSKQDEYNTYFNKKSPKYYKAEKPKSNGKYTMPKINLDSFDWDLWLREHDKNYQTLEEENKKAGLGDIEQDLANEYWQEQYQNYLNQGGTLNYQQFMQQQMNLKVSREIDKRVKEKMKTEGIAQILSLPLDKI